MVLVVVLFLLQLIETQQVISAVSGLAENQSELASPVTSTISTISNLKRNDWWPPSSQDVVTQISPYTTELQHSVPPSYYIPAPLYPPVSHYRNVEWTPYGYPEFGYQVAPSLNNQIAVPAKYVSVALFIGLLTLFAIIQGAMMVSKHRESMDSLLARKKRDLLVSTDFYHMTREQQDVLDIDARIQCIQWTICLENRQLLKYLGPVGSKLAKYLTRSVGKSVKSASSGWDRQVEDAGAAGLRGDDCSVLYRDCVLPLGSETVETR
ncbi:uncharacterized protein [Fopius arisanus]|uniref:Uncharacterized protein n=2 Tax=Fopius arisanus TaxID=64838 RepID=A0A9R1TQV1_9HYME|nr:PREDICTED: uncharacterized protein LOC105272679 [Fopius arisanus]